MVVGAPFLSSLSGHLAIIYSINLVTKEYERESLHIVRTGVLNEAILPFVESIKACRVSQVISECAAVSTTVECEAERLELLLTGRVPNLKRDNLSINLDLLLGEISTDRGLSIAGSLLMHVLRQQGRLSYARVTEDDNLDEVSGGHLVRLSFLLICLRGKMDNSCKVIIYNVLMSVNYYNEYALHWIDDE